MNIFGRATLIITIVCLLAFQHAMYIDDPAQQTMWLIASAIMGSAFIVFGGKEIGR